MLSHVIPEIGSVELIVPTLGEVKGISYDNQICQYLGIPYGTIPGRFRRPQPAGPWENGKWDGTKLGPYCPQPQRDFYPIPAASRQWLEMPGPDELNCLNLNITVPSLPNQNKGPLPIMVFLHGGAFTYAMGSAPIYDGRLLASNSATEYNRPTIVITMNYRLGVYGFLAGRDIQAYNKECGEAGVGNYGIWDQVLALRWIQNHIAGFGGDPERVTLFGQSAGAVSVHCHLLRNEPLFSSAILQSGLIRLCGVFSIDEYGILYEKMLEELGISLELSSTERIKRFLDADTAKVTAAMVPVFITPVITMGLCDDQTLIPGPIPKPEQYQEFKAPSWCPRIMMGDCAHECIIWNKAWSNLSPLPMDPSVDLSTPTGAGLLTRMYSFLGPEKAKIVADLYEISPSMSDKACFDVVERCTSHGMYSILNYFAQLATPSIYAWHFDVPSPYDNAWKGMAHHSFDNVLIWGVLKHTLPEAHKRISEVMGEMWIKFTNGEAPWEEFGDKQRWMVFRESGPKLMNRDEDAGRGYLQWDALHKNGLVPEFFGLCEELCIRRSHLLDPSVRKGGSHTVERDVNQNAGNNVM